MVISLATDTPPRRGWGIRCGRGL